MEESEILESMKDQDVVDVYCMTKKDKNVRTKTVLLFLTSILNEIPEYVNIGYKRVQVRPCIQKPLQYTKNPDTPH